MLSRQAKKVIKEDVELNAIHAHRAYYEGEREDIEVENPTPDWMTKKMAKVMRPFDEKIMFEAFSHALLRAFKKSMPPKGFEIVLVKAAANIELMMMMATCEPMLRMSIKEVIDKHFRLWIKESTEIQKWIENDEIVARAILLSAGDFLMAHFEVFDGYVRALTPHYRENIQKDIEAQATQTAPDKEEDSRPKAGSGSGLHNSIKQD